MNFIHYLQELQNNLTRGSERTHYPALKNLVDKRKLSPDDIIHYQKIVVALKNTIEIMQEIDTIIPNFPIE